MLPSGTFNVRPEQDMAIFRTRTQWFLLFVLIVVLLFIPHFIPDWWLRQTFIYAGIFVIAVLGLHILTGLCGLFSIGQAAFMAVGAYSAALLASRLGLSGWVTLPLCGIIAGLVGVIFGAPSVRIKGFYLAMATLAAQFIIGWCFTSIDWLGWEGGRMGLDVAPLELGSMSFRDPTNFYYVVLVLVIVMTFLAKNLQRTRTGRVFIAIRDNDLAAEVMGINLFRYKLLAFFIGCFYAGIAGWLMAYNVRYVSMQPFGVDDSIWLLGMLVVGGMGSTTGAIFGAVGLRSLEVAFDHIGHTLQENFSGIDSSFIYGGKMVLFATVVILFMIFVPKGLYHRWEVFKANYRLYPYSY